jgi:hypothetical protein
MIQSAAYDLIKQEGILEGEVRNKRQAVCDVLEERFNFVPPNILKMLNQIEEIRALETLLRKAVKVEDLAAFHELMQQALTLAKP